VERKIRKRKCLPVFLLLMLSAASVMAQPVYKTVGPDGKVTFSDEPPASGKTTALEGYGPPPKKEVVPDAKMRAAEVRRQAQERYEAKKANPVPQESVAPVGSRAVAIDPVLGEAVIGVQGIEDIVKQTEKLCISTLPTSYKRYGGAAESWRQRNATVLQRQRAVTSQALTLAQRNMIESTVKAKNGEQLAPVLNAPTVSKIKWCDQSADEMNRGDLDFSKYPKWTAALANWRPGMR